jgi:K+-transporting ATPase ATPase C chain
MTNTSQNGKRRRKNENQQEAAAESTDRQTSETAGTEASPQESGPRSRKQVILDYLRPAVVLTLVLTLIVGVAYPLVITGVAQALFNNQANGSLVTKNGQTIGSTQIGQEWTDPKYFHGRPSATLSNDGSQSQPYNAANSSASNNGPTSSNLQAEVQAELKLLQEDEACNASGTPIPVDLVTSSGSGLDPDISVAGAMYQACRIARERGMSLAQVQQLIQNHIHGRTLGVLGEPYVNVLELNMALDASA